LKEIQTNGLLPDTDDGLMICTPTQAIGNIAELPRLDYCFICVKGYDLDSVLLQLKDKISAGTIILPLLNGVDIHQRIRKIITTGYLHPACVYVGTHLVKFSAVDSRHVGLRSSAEITTQQLRSKSSVPKYRVWIPAFAGMTLQHEFVNTQ
jgi:ketopantoate reductase